MAHGQQSDFIVKINESLHYYLAAAGTSAFLRNMPGIVNILFSTYYALTVSGRTHDRLDDTRETDFCNSSIKFPPRGSKPVWRCRNSESFGCKPSDPLPVHSNPRGHSRRNNIITFLLQFNQLVGRNSLDLGDYIIRLFIPHYPRKGFPVKHRQDIT